MISLATLQTAAEQGFIYGLVALALYLSYRVLDIADLTTDGSFTLGAAASAMLAALGHPLLGILCAVAAGGAAGPVAAAVGLILASAACAGILSKRGPRMLRAL